MEKTPKSNRIHIAIFGRTNVGKSSFLNYIVGQDVAITSPVAGTTTDVVEKTMELLPIGPVVFLDTAGLDDATELAKKRLAKTAKVFERADAAVLLVESGVWTEYEENVTVQAKAKKIPVLAVVNKSDLNFPGQNYLELLAKKTGACMTANSLDSLAREKTLAEFKTRLARIIPDDLLSGPPLIGDLVAPGGIAFLVVPIDLEAPKGRIILPQVQAIRDALDTNAIAVVAKESELKTGLEKLKTKPDIVVCDSQAVSLVCRSLPEDILVTTFSILYARYKSDLCVMARGAAHIARLTPQSRVLIAESCTHHPIGDDIGRVKIPKWLSEYLGFTVSIDTCAGRDYPENIRDYDLIIHCGACMFNRRQMLYRLENALASQVPITNYGLSISYLQRVIIRVLQPFPEALAAFQAERKLVQGKKEVKMRLRLAELL